MDADRRVSIRTDRDIVEARQQGRILALEIGFSPGDATVISAAISEIARNIFQYAGQGEVSLLAVHRGEQQGVQIVGTDHGPGIRDLQKAMMDGYSTSGSLGLGLPGAKRLMDEFEVDSRLGFGTTITMRKWRR
jgi:serine/threonine-protein kinase RsbT